MLGEASRGVAGRLGGHGVEHKVYKIKGKTRHQNAREGLNPAGTSK